MIRILVGLVFYPWLTDEQKDTLDFNILCREFGDHGAMPGRPYNLTSDQIYYVVAALIAAASIISILF